MENRSRLSFVNSKKLGRSIFSSYDNDTFVPDQEFEIVKRNANSLDDIIVEKENEESEKCGCSGDINHGSNTITIINENELSDYDPNHNCKCGNVENNNTRNKIVNHGDNHNTLVSENIKNSETIISSRLNELKAPTGFDTKRKSPPLNVKSLSLDGNKRTNKNTATNQPCRNQSAPRKLRSFSDTRNPLLFHRLNPKLRQLEEINPDKKRKKSAEVSSYISSNENVPEDKLMNGHESGCADSDKTKRNKRWMRKLARYATFDEGSVYLAKSNKPNGDLSPTDEISEAKEEINLDCNEPLTKEAPVQRKISTGKMIKQSMSQGFSKFKQLSISGKSGNRKIEQEYAMIDNDADFHETSKRLDPLPATDILPSIFNVDTATDSSVPNTLFRRCSSLPDLIDSSSICDEEINDLYLPRRMAICPDLAVPAMKQLRTYLVLTRLKQYCIV